MRYMWKGLWKNGEVTIEANDPTELDEGLQNLGKIESFQDKASLHNANIPSVRSEQTVDEVPKLAGNLHCKEAVEQALDSEWGRKPRMLSDLRSVLEQNALYFSRGALSGMLTYLTKKGDLRRVKTNGDSWGYVLNKK